MDMNKNYYVIAIHKFVPNKLVAFPAKHSKDECKQDIVKYDKADNKTGQNFRYIIVTEVEEENNK